LLVAVEAEQQTIPHQTEPLEATHNLHQLFLLEVVKAVLLLRLMRRVQVEVLVAVQILLALLLALLVQETLLLDRQVKEIMVELLPLVVHLIFLAVVVVARAVSAVTLRLPRVATAVLEHLMI
jgi:hypothetical protein